MRRLIVVFKLSVLGSILLVDWDRYSSEVCKSPLLGILLWGVEVRYSLDKMASEVLSNAEILGVKVKLFGFLLLFLVMRI